MSQSPRPQPPENPGPFSLGGQAANPSGTPAPALGGPSGSGEPPPEVLHEMLETFRHSGASVVFGEARQINGATLIPVAATMVGFGFGQGRGPAQTGGGGGGGGFTKSRPLGFVIIENQQARFCPTFDVSRIALTGLVISGILTALWLVFRR